MSAARPEGRWAPSPRPLHDARTRVYRYEVPVDDQWHELVLIGEVIHLASRRPEVVELWALTDGPRDVRDFRAVGTGQPWPESAVYIGTTLTDVGLVWHLLERP